MSSISYDLGELKASYINARKTADRLDEYAEKLQSNVMRKLDSLTLGSSSSTSSCYSYMQIKVKEINEKSSAYREYAEALDNLRNDSDGIIETDKKVATKIKEMSSIFCKANGYSTSKLFDFFVWATTAYYNQTALGRWLKRIVTSFKDWLEDVKDAIKYWYRCDGGKYTIKIVTAVVALIVAIGLLVLVWPAMLGGILALIGGQITFAALSAIAAGILAVIDVANRSTHLVWVCKARKQHNTDPAWAKRYDGYETIATFLKKHRFNSKNKNKVSVFASKAITGVTIVCMVITGAELARSGYMFVKQANAIRVQNLAKIDIDAVPEVKEIATTVDDVANAKVIERGVNPGTRTIKDVEAPILPEGSQWERNVLNSFTGGKANPVTYEGGTVLYRVGGKNGGFWSLDIPPATEYQWRVDTAIKQEFCNDASRLYTMTIPQGASLAGIEGKVGSQGMGLYGGAHQVYIDYRAVPEDWIEISKMIWK